MYFEGDMVHGPFLPIWIFIYTHYSIFSVLIIIYDYINGNCYIIYI